MANTLKIALVLSAAAHMALLMMRWHSEPLVEGNLLSLDVRLNVETDGATEPISASIPEEPETATEAEALVEPPPEDTQPEAPGTLIAEETIPPASVEETTALAETTPIEASVLEQPEQAESAPESIETVEETMGGPTTVAIPERLVTTLTPLQIIVPRPTPAQDGAAALEATAKRSERPRVAFTEREQRMLDRKVEVWSATFHRMDPTEPTVTWKHRGQSYTATFEQVSAQNDRGIDELLIEISKEDNGERLSTELRLKRLAFSNFAQFVDKWDSGVSLHDDEIGGRFHSNSEVRLAFDHRAAPIFHGKVTTSFRGINTDSARGGVKRSEMFLGGLETRVRRISLPRELSLFPRDAEGEQVHHFEEDTRVTFYPNGTFGRQPLNSVEPETIVSIGELSAYLIAGPKVALHVQGTVNGAVLVYSPRNIVIENDLVYAADPEVNPESDDYLGLVSGRFVRIANAQTTGEGDLLIHASIYAKRRFSVGRFRSRNDGVLVIYGSLTAGSISATEPRYSTKILFDPRLEEVRVPSFPMTDRYEILAWDSTWARPEGSSGIQAYAGPPQQPQGEMSPSTQGRINIAGD